jgi:hypothetical protein
MSNEEMFEASFQRPKNYFRLSVRQQWDIDESLGILDWNPSHMTDADKERFKQHYKESA